MAEPFARTAGVHGTRVGSVQFSLGSFYGWFAHMLLGATIVGLLSLSISLERVGRLRALLWAIAGLVVGGAFACAADAGSDALWIKVFRSQPTSRQFHTFSSICWNLAVAIAMATAIAICTQPTVARVRRCLVAGLAAGFAGFVARMALAPIFSMIQLGMIIENGFKVVSNPWIPFDPSRLADYVTMGLVLGLSFGAAESMLATGRLRHILGRNEGRTYLLGAGINRIGSAEGIEVPIFGDPAIAPVHATIYTHLGQLAISDCNTRIGTIVNGMPVSSAYLQIGDQITLGNQVLVVEGLGRVRSSAPYPAPIEVAPQRAPVAVPVVACRHTLTDSFGSVIELSLGDNTIGRSTDATISVPHSASVSRIHARIVVAGGAAVLTDLNSRNGTVVNGNLLKGQHNLASGDVVQFGRENMEYRVQL